MYRLDPHKLFSVFQVYGVYPHNDAKMELQALFLVGWRTFSISWVLIKCIFPFNYNILKWCHIRRDGANNCTHTRTTTERELRLYIPIYNIPILDNTVLSPGSLFHKVAKLSMQSLCHNIIHHFPPCPTSLFPSPTSVALNKGWYVGSTKLNLHLGSVFCLCMCVCISACVSFCFVFLYVNV